MDKIGAIVIQKNLADLVTEIASRRGKRAFSPCAFYNADGDTLEVYLSGEEFVARRVDGFLTFFVAPGSASEVLGFALKDLKRNLRETDIRWPSHKVLSGAFLLSLAVYLWERTHAESGRKNGPERRTRESLLELYREHADERIRFRNSEALAAE
jgi:hypothetical protein